MKKKIVYNFIQNIIKHGKYMFLNIKEITSLYQDWITHYVHSHEHGTPFTLAYVY